MLGSFLLCRFRSWIVLSSALLFFAEPTFPIFPESKVVFPEVSCVGSGWW